MGWGRNEGSNERQRVFHIALLDCWQLQQGGAEGPFCSLNGWGAWLCLMPNLTQGHTTARRGWTLYTKPTTINDWFLLTDLVITWFHLAQVEKRWILFSFVGLTSQYVSQMDLLWGYMITTQDKGNGEQHDGSEGNIANSKTTILVAVGYTGSHTHSFAFWEPPWQPARFRGGTSISDTEY